MEGFEPHRVPPWPEDPTANIGHDIAVKPVEPELATLLELFAVH
jgi:hypothetical protein